MKEDTPLKRNEKEWVWVCVQHPMPLLVEDRGEPAVLERIPPWGDPTLDAYMTKFNDVCDSLESYPQLRIDFEISARELEDVAQASPSTLARLKGLWQQGRLGFVGGDYSQAHYHVFGSESCLRQIEMGLSVFRDLVGCKIRVFFHQETGLHEQLPQILRAFGYTVAVPPRFPWALTFTEGQSVEIASHFGTLEFVRDDDLTSWQGLDGTTIPLYLSMPAPSLSDEILEVFKKHASGPLPDGVFEPREPFAQFMNRERYKAPVNVPKILIETPDMKRLSGEYVQSRGAVCSFSTLSDALEACIHARSPKGTASLYAYWSYIEGVWAEQMSRTNRKAETAVFLAEALDALRVSLRGGDASDTSGIWRKILSSQHHDVYWIETTDLKRRAIKWLDDAIGDSQALCHASLQSIFESSGSAPSRSDGLFAVNPLPTARSGVCELYATGDQDAEWAPGLRKALGDSLLVLPTTSPDGPHELLVAGLDNVPGLGWAPVSSSRPVTPRSGNSRGTMGDVFELETAAYSVRVERGGIFSRLTEKASGAELIKGAAIGANEIRGRLHTGDWVSSRNFASPLTVAEGPFATVVSLDDKLGPVSLHEDIIFYLTCARIDFRLTLAFGQTPLALGDFWDDDSKLNVFWPADPEREIVHDIPFGIVPARSGRPLYCTSFIDISDERAGLAYFNRGTTKHWIKERILANVLAWGGNKFSNRHPGLWEYVDKYDLGLQGTHTIEYAIFPHQGDYRRGSVPREAQAYYTPLPVFRSRTGIPASLTGRAGLDMTLPNLICTAVLPDARGIRLRVYEAFGRVVQLKEVRNMPGFSECTVVDLAGKRIQAIHPFQICVIHANR